MLAAAGRGIQPWKNGGGVTSEIAVLPGEAPGADFEWRLSMAKVAEPAVFSHFAGIDRTLAVVSGRLALELEHETRRIELSPDSVPIGFGGEALVVGTPIGGPVVDLNLMTRRGHWSGSIERIASAEGTLPTSSQNAILLFTGAARLRWRGEEFALQPLDAVHIQDGADNSLNLETTAPAYLVKLFRGRFQGKCPVTRAG
ncbi:MAG: HutD family protein [Candidatus Andeanibacterium colombiense]|uniref:HutD family protein n=1 Tax=Candidatus Andeanibacterium colombiense TaxID=3121345 RepID=A0AAJ6BMT0_9SPHN|nr:MAG: HutD family protein [Sphingomonadaceae bacterium]